MVSGMWEAIRTKDTESMLHEMVDAVLNEGGELHFAVSGHEMCIEMELDEPGEDVIMGSVDEAIQNAWEKFSPILSEELALMLLPRPALAVEPAQIEIAGDDLLT